MLYALLENANSQTYTSNNFSSVVDLNTDVNNLLYVHLLDRGIYTLLENTNSQTYTSNNFSSVVDLSTDIDNLLYLEILNQDELQKLIFVTEESIIETGKIFYSVDFVAITSFNVPTPEPLALPQRWAG
jgi:predicted TPR repeat methyltransferase